MGRTDAKKKGDLVDLFLETARRAEELDYPAAVQDYPQETKRILIYFYRIWRLPVPDKYDKNYKRWCKDLDEIRYAMPINDRLVKAFKATKDRYDESQWHIESPKSIYKVLLEEYDKTLPF